MAAAATARDTKAAADRAAIIMVVITTADRAAIITAVITMDNITGRVTRTMARVTGVIRMDTMVLADAAQGMFAVTCGVRIHSANVWEGICAVAFKDKGSSMGRHTYGTCGNFNSVKRCY